MTEREESDVGKLIYRGDLLEAENQRLQRDNERLRGVLADVKLWCELNRREGSVLYKPVCAALGAT